ncbi:hypothetical protein Patl1_06577 [Pistacia atlantica]|uniref:Uncharacterized protein n=1 Tax=Pistacia atlantica TaxID=434234 RepID=A0ACC1BT43_9ROSI|nr:hypothetical protein Patl1_06577 [Pistacia atlantica]
MGSKVSTYGDVYSYGILLLEMFTRKRPTDEMFNGNLNLHNFVKAALPERVAEIMDPEILRETEEQTSMTTARNLRSSTRRYGILECLTSISVIGVTCSSEMPSERMHMDEVAAQLISIRNKLLETPRRGERQTSHTIRPVPTTIIV